MQGTENSTGFEGGWVGLSEIAQLVSCHNVIRRMIPIWVVALICGQIRSVSLLPVAVITPL
jgi:hypothetical protein